MKSILRASVIVPVHNGARTIEGCLRSLIDQTVHRSEYEILLVDDGSTDGTGEIAARFPVRIIQQPHQGPAAARNRGAAGASGQILLFTDADAEPARDWIEQMLVPFEHLRVAGAKGVYRTRQGELMARFVQSEYEEKYARTARVEKLDLVDTYSAAYRREVVVANGGFDESFPSASTEDAEFSYRLAKLGYRFVFLPDAIVFHHHPRTLGAYLRRKFRVAYWRVRVHMRHPDKALSDSHTPLTQKFQVAAFPLLVLLGIITLLYPIMSLMWWALAMCFALSMLPLVTRAWRRDLLVGLVAPFLIICRAAAQSLGICCGVVNELLRVSPVGRVIVALYRRSRTGLSSE